MIWVVLAACLVAGLNVAGGRYLGRLDQGKTGPRWAWAQSGLFLARFVVIFGVTLSIFRWTGRRDWMVLFYVTGAIVQMVGQIWLLLADSSRKTGATSEHVI